MSLKRDVDQQRLDQIAPRLVSNGPSPTLRQRLRILRMQLREAGQWAGRNTGQRPIIINHPPSPSQGPPRPTGRAFPADGGQTPDQRLVTVANDIGERSLADEQARQRHQEKVGAMPAAEEKAMDQAALHAGGAESTPDRGKEDFTRKYTGPKPPKPSGPRPDAPRPKR